MKRSTMMIVMTMAMACVCGDSDARAEQAPGKYAPIEFVVGSCWIGTFADGRTTDTHCFEWMYDRKFIRDRHMVNSTLKYEGETLYTWDPATGKIVFRYVSNMGLLLDGSAEQQGDQIIFPGKYIDGNGRPVDAQAAWTRIGEDAYRATNSEKTPEGWKTVFTIEYHRKY